MSTWLWTKTETHFWYHVGILASAVGCIGWVALLDPVDVDLAPAEISTAASPVAGGTVAANTSLGTVRTRHADKPAGRAIADLSQPIGAAAVPDNPRPASLINAGLPRLQVAERIEAEVGRTAALTVALGDLREPPEGAILKFFGVPDSVALFPATPMGSGTWQVDLPEAKFLRMKRYSADVQERLIEVHLVARDNAPIAVGQTKLVSLGGEPGHGIAAATAGSALTAASTAALHTPSGRAAPNQASNATGRGGAARRAARTQTAQIRSTRNEASRRLSATWQVERRPPRGRANRFRLATSAEWPMIWLGNGSRRRR